MWVQQKPGTLHGIGFSQIVSQIPSPKYSDGVRRGHERGSVLTDTIYNCRYTVIIKSKYTVLFLFFNSLQKMNSLMRGGDHAHCSPTLHLSSFCCTLGAGSHPARTRKHHTFLNLIPNSGPSTTHCLKVISIKMSQSPPQTKTPVCSQVTFLLQSNLQVSTKGGDARPLSYQFGRTLCGMIAKIKRSFMKTQTLRAHHIQY